MNSQSWLKTQNSIICIDTYDFKLCQNYTDLFYWITFFQIEVFNNRNYSCLWKLWVSHPIHVVIVWKQTISSSRVNCTWIIGVPIALCNSSTAKRLSNESYEFLGTTTILVSVKLHIETKVKEIFYSCFSN